MRLTNQDHIFFFFLKWQFRKNVVSKIAKNLSSSLIKNAGYLAYCEWPCLLSCCSNSWRIQNRGVDISIVPFGKFWSRQTNFSPSLTSAKFDFVLHWMTRLNNMVDVAGVRNEFKWLNLGLLHLLDPHYSNC